MRTPEYTVIKENADGSTTFSLRCGMCMCPIPLAISTLFPDSSGVFILERCPCCSGGAQTFKLDGSVDT